MLEAWITPELFNNLPDPIVDEFTFTALQPRDVAEATLKRHYETFIQEDDFRQIAEAGLSSCLKSFISRS